MSHGVRSPLSRGQKLVVGTQLGILSVFNRRSGYGDCVDRIPGHPHSIDALCNIPSHYPDAQSTILTGSSDGFVRAVQILPTKLLGVVADHGDFPVERIAIDRGGEGRWVASSGHDEVLKLTDLKEVFEDDGDEEEEDEEGDNGEEDGKAEAQDSDAGEEKEDEKEEEKDQGSEGEAEPEADLQAREDSSDDGAFVEKKRKRKKDKDPLRAAKKTKGKNEIEADASFFADL